MRILIVTQYFWPESFLVNSLASELQKKGHSVSVLTGLPNYPSGKLMLGYSYLRGPWIENNQGVHVMRVPILARGRGFLRLALNYFSFVFSGSLFSIFHKTKNHDVIFCYAPSPVTSCLPAIFIRALSKKPLIFWVQDLWPESVSAVGAMKSSLTLRAIGRLVRFIYERCDLILVQSQAFKASVIKWGGRENQIQYVPNWADPFVPQKNTPVWVSDLPLGFKIAFAGNIGKAQDMPTIISAAEILKDHVDIQWIIAGEGSDKAWLDQQIQKRNLQHCVKAVGRKPYDEMLPFFSHVDALLVSLVDEYIFSLTVPAKVQAYMSSAKPIIASVAGEGARIVNEAQAGVTCAPQNPQALANAVLALKAKSEQERLQMGERAREYFNKNFERSVVIQKIEDLIQQTVSGAP